MDGRRLAFCAGVAKGLSPRDAAREAGYSESFSNTKAYMLENDPAIADMIETMRKKVVEVIALGAAEVINEIGAIAVANPVDFLAPDVVDGQEVFRWKRPDELTPVQKAAVKSVRLITKTENQKDGSGQSIKVVVGQEYVYHLHDKVKSLEMLGKYFKIFDSEPGKEAVEDFSGMSHEKMVEAWKFVKRLQHTGSEEEAVDGEVLSDGRG